MVLEGALYKLLQESNLSEFQLACLLGLNILVLFLIAILFGYLIYSIFKDVL